MLKKNVAILFFFIVTIQLAFCQLSRTQLIGSYIYNFAKHTSWQNQENFDVFRITAFTENQEIIDELSKMAKTQTVNGTNIILKINSGIEANFNESQIIYISEDMTHLFLDIYDKIEGKEILIVSENYDNKKLVMLNLYDTNDNKLRFEMNKANIHGQGLTVGDEVLIIGGDEINVIDLYLKSQQSLRSMEKQIGSYEHKLLIFNNQIAKSKSNIDDQNQIIRNQEKTIASQQNEFNKIDKELKTLTGQFNEQHDLIEKEKLKLVLLNDSLLNNKKILDNQLAEIEIGKQTLSEQEARINSMNVELSNKNVALVERDETITRQQQTMYGFATLIALIIILAIVLGRALNKNKDKNIMLSQQKNELNIKNVELSDTIHKLNNTQNQLVNSEKMASLGVLTAGIAHEINNPINFVYTGAANLKQEFKEIYNVMMALDSKVTNKDEAFELVQKIAILKEKHDFDDSFELIPQIIEDIEIGAQRTAEIVVGLKNFSRMDQSSFSNIDIHKVIEGTLVLLKNEYKTKVEIIKNFESDLPIIEGTPGKINQVFLNIVNNAIDAIDTQGSIIFTSSSTKSNIKISIKDDGIGMDDLTVERIFDPFYTTKEVGKGTGLGLSISFGIINEHNGTIEVKSKIDKGTEFIITLPLSQTLKEETT